MTSSDLPIARQTKVFHGWAVRLLYPAGPDAKYSGYAGIGYIDPALLVKDPPVLRTAVLATRRAARRLAIELRQKGWAGARVERVKVTVEPC